MPELLLLIAAIAIYTLLLLTLEDRIIYLRDLHAAQPAEDERRDEKLAALMERQQVRKKLFEGNRPFDLQTVIWDIDTLLSLLPVQPAQQKCLPNDLGRCPIHGAIHNRPAASTPTSDDAFSHDLACGRWVPYDEIHRRYYPDKVCTCGAAASPLTGDCKLGDPLMHGPRPYRWCETHQRLMMACETAAASTEAQDEK